MVDRPPSNYPPAHPLGVNDALAQVRAYSDDAALDRVWNRLETRRRRHPGLAPASRAAVAGVLVAAGVFLGMFIERQRAVEEPVAQVSSEMIQAPGIPAGPRHERARFAAPARETTKKEKEKARARRTVKRLSAPVKALGPAEEAPVEEVEEVEVVEVEEVVAPPKAEWLALAERGEFAASFQQLDESGGFDVVVATGSSEELMMLVEVARYVGRQGRAIQALRAVTERHQGDPNAPIAAMILGNLLSRAGDAAGAAEAYALNRHLSPGGDFAEDALVREFDMAEEHGDLASVERLRGQYESEFPEGRHLDDLRTRAARLADRSAASVPSSTAAEHSTVGEDEEASANEAPEHAPDKSE